MKYAYISLNELVRNYNGTILGARILTINSEKIFGEDDQLFYKECSDDIISHKVYYDVDSQLILEIPPFPLTVINTGTSTTISVS